MTSSPNELGALLDNWIDDGRAQVLEGAANVTVTGLTVALAQELFAALVALAWPRELFDAAQEPAGVDDLDEDMGPFRLTFVKPAAGVDTRMLTRSGFTEALKGETLGVWQLAFCNASFSSGLASFSPWGQGDVFAPATETKSPLDLVREGSEARLVPADVRKWLVRGRVNSELWQDAAFAIFASLSAPALLRSLASEVVGPSALVFNGPPRLNLALPGDVLDKLGLVGFTALLKAVAWVYEDRSSAEQRHALFAAEAARSITRAEPIGEAFASAGSDILEGARLSFQLSQSEISREAIKAQGDLRKSIADDTAKAAEGTRTVAGAIAVAIATGVGLVAARTTTTAEPWVLSLVAAIVGLYLAAVAISGWMHLGLQRRLRSQWRNRFYRFIPADDYKAMVTDPAKDAERPYHVMAGIALVVAAALFWLSFSNFGPAEGLDKESASADISVTAGGRSSPVSLPSYAAQKTAALSEPSGKAAEATAVPGR